MVLRDFRCVSARAAYRGVKNVDLHPLFLLWREEGVFYITSVSEKKTFSACTEQFVWTYMRYIYSFRQKIYKEEMTHG